MCHLVHCYSLMNVGQLVNRAIDYWIGLLCVVGAVRVEVPRTCTAVRQHYRVFTQILQSGKQKCWEAACLGQGHTANHCHDFPGHSALLLANSTLRQEVFWFKCTGMGFYTRSPQQHELHVSGDTFMCFAWLCVSVGEGWDCSWLSVTAQRSQWLVQWTLTWSRLVCTKSTPTLTDSSGILLK